MHQKHSPFTLKLSSLLISLALSLPLQAEQLTAGQQLDKLISQTNQLMQSITGNDELKPSEKALKRLDYLDQLHARLADRRTMLIHYHSAIVRNITQLKNNRLPSVLPDTSRNQQLSLLEKKKNKLKKAIVKLSRYMDQIPLWVEAVAARRVLQKMEDGWGNAEIFLTETNAIQLNPFLVQAEEAFDTSL